MKSIKMIIELEYDDEIMHSADKDKEALESFENDILLGTQGLLLLHSNEIGDTVGRVKGLEILKPCA